MRSWNTFASFSFDYIQNTVVYTLGGTEARQPGKQTFIKQHFVGSLCTWIVKSKQHILEQIFHQYVLALLHPPQWNEECFLQLRLWPTESKPALCAVYFERSTMGGACRASGVSLAGR